MIRDGDRVLVTWPDGTRSEAEVFCTHPRRGSARVLLANGGKTWAALDWLQPLPTQ